MSYFAKLGNSISSKSKEIAKKARAASEINSLNNIVKTEQRKIDTNYRMIGKSYFEKFENSPEDEFGEAVKDIRLSLDKIAETQEQIRKIKTRSCCPECGTPFKPDAFFCSKCGYKLKNDIPDVSAEKCRNCGNVLESGALFCDSCGERVEQQADEPEKTAAEMLLSDDTVSDNVTMSEPTVAESTESCEIEESTEAVGVLKKCPSCGTVADDPDAAFCNNCGEKL